jgi:hypothetical protein
MIIVIHIHFVGQKILRPFNRASSFDEMCEMLKTFIVAERMQVTDLKLHDNFGTDEPIIKARSAVAEVEFFAFLED